METKDPVKEYKNKIKKLTQKEWLIAFNNANPDKVKNKAEKEQNEYFEGKKKALKEYYNSMVVEIELKHGIDLTRYMEKSKDEKKSVIQRWIKQHNITFKKDKITYLKLYAKAYYELNKEQFKLYYELNKEQFKLYYELNKEQFRLYSKIYAKKNKEKINAKERKYYHKNKEKNKERKAIYYQKNKEKFKKHNQKYYQKSKALKLQQQETQPTNNLIIEE